MQFKLQLVSWIGCLLVCWISNLLLRWYLMTRTLFLIPPKIFGCICFVHIDKISRSKLDPKALECIFWDYSPTEKEYKCYRPPTHRQLVSMDVTFHETIPFFFVGKSSPQEGIVLMTVRLLPLSQYPLSSLIRVLKQRLSMPRGSTVRNIFKFIGKNLKQLQLKILMSHAKISPLIQVTSPLTPSIILIFLLLWEKALDLVLNIIFVTVSYNALSTSTHSFVVALLSVAIPRNVYKALAQPH